ncbi:MAG: FAD-dependent oxidoreductase [Acidobacteriaceae bacterium]|nr:FAD-dependent oxidoreductase [Acidobacteriaceae bacterium]MBV8573273.1 FAD-dependent oxidoreductase [Acidobacteriaceae bacterium]
MATPPDPQAAFDVPSFRPDMAFPYLTGDMIGCIRNYATEREYDLGTQLSAAGQREADMFVILTGGIEVYTMDDSNQLESIIKLGPLQFTGELNLLNDQPPLVSARTSAPNSRLLRISRQNLRQLMRDEGDIANLIMQAFIWRRIGLVSQTKTGVVLFGKEGEAETLKLQQFLSRNGYPHRLVQGQSPAHVHSNVESGRDHEPLPAIGLSDGRVLYRPTIPRLADELGITEIPDASTLYDVAVVGAGPAGLAAAVYAASEGLSTVVVEGIAPGGQAGTSSKIENYLGFPTGISGQRLAHRAWVQSLKFGVRFAIAREAIGVEPASGFHRLALSEHICLCGRSVIVATGARYRKLNARNLEKFENQGVYYAATAMEAAFCRNNEVIVVGGGNSAGQAALFLSHRAAHVYLLIRGRALAQTMSQYLLSRIETSQHISVLTETEIVSLAGDSRLEEVTWINRRTGVQTSKRTDTVFLMIGADPNTQWLNGLVNLDEKGFVKTGGRDAFEQTPYATNIAGIYAVGDVRSASVKRVASAVGEGSVVISDVHRYFAHGAGVN